MFSFKAKVLNIPPKRVSDKQRFMNVQIMEYKRIKLMYRQALFRTCRQIRLEIPKKFVLSIDLKAEKYSCNLSFDRLETKYESFER